MLTIDRQYAIKKNFLIHKVDSSITIDGHVAMTLKGSIVFRLLSTPPEYAFQVKPTM